MQIDLKKLAAALENPKDRAGRKYLSGLTETFRREEPEKYAQIMKKPIRRGRAESRQSAAGAHGRSVCLR